MSATYRLVVAIITIFTVSSVLSFADPVPILWPQERTIDSYTLASERCKGNGAPVQQSDALASENRQHEKVKVADDLGCDYNTCDSKNPCNQGCKCVYPQGASVGYCVPWYQK